MRASWFVQRQQVTGYQSLDDLYCVSATYDLEGKTVPFFSGTVVSVFNVENKGSVTGPPQNPPNPKDPLKKPSALCARVKDAAAPEKLEVAPCFLPNLLAGPYWVVAAGPARQTFCGRTLLLRSNTPATARILTLAQCSAIS